MARRWPEVRGVDYGRVYKDGKPLKTFGIRFHLGRKRPLLTLSPDEVLPIRMDGLRCDVLEASYSLESGAKGICDPLQPGVSVGNMVRGTTGTLGLWVRDELTGASGIVSNWHVLCGSPQAVPGDAIGQPGPRYQRTERARIVATLERWAGLDEGADAALALLAPNMGASAILYEQSLAVSGVTAPRHGMKVVKYGVTSGLTEGEIDGISGAYKMNYSDYGDTERWIDGLRIVVDPEAPRDEISLAGDSGAIWVERETGKAVALHFAGEDGLGPTAEYALAQPIGRVLERLNVRLA
jgi:hypothetical protein